MEVSQIVRRVSLFLVLAGMLSSATAWAQAPIGYIEVQFLHRVTGDPLVSGVYPFPHFQLYRCTDATCSSSEYYSDLPIVTDTTGTAIIPSLDENGEPILAGTFFLDANTGEGGVTTRGDRFIVAEGQEVDLGTFFVNSPPLPFTLIQACPTIPAKGGKCRLRVRITNQTYPARRIKGTVWIIANAHGVGERNRSVFQLPGQRVIDLKPLQSVVIDFFLRAPASVSNDARICFQAFAGIGTSAPQLDPITSQDLIDPNGPGTGEGFCVEKGVDEALVASK